MITIVIQSSKKQQQQHQFRVKSKQNNHLERQEKHRKLSKMN